MKEICVYGAGGHGKVVADIISSAGLGRLLGFLDDSPKAWNQTVFGLPVLGGFEWLRSHQGTALEIALGIGDNLRRLRVAEKLRQGGWTLHTAVHPSATVARGVAIGAGSVVMAQVVVNPDAQLGDGLILNTAAVVEHDVRIGEFAHISPNASLGGGVTVGRLTQVGLGAVVLPGVRVGESVVVGAGAVVTRHTSDRVVLVGVPAREHPCAGGAAAGK